MREIPELPEVETICRYLQEKLIGNTILKVKIHDPKLYLTCPADLDKRLQNKNVVKLQRKGKYLVVRLSEKLNLLWHLRMTGKLVLIPAASSLLPQHSRAEIALSGNRKLVFVDCRRFGTLSLLSDEELQAKLAALGPDCLDKRLLFHRITSLPDRDRKLKALLLDQKAMAGIGNIYADEILFEACLDPEVSFRLLTDKHKNNLLNAIESVLSCAVQHRGTTFRDYLDAAGQEGDFQKHLKVYRRAGQDCFRCAGVIQKKKVAGRGTYYCPACQDKPV